MQHTSSPAGTREAAIVGGLVLTLFGTYWAALTLLFNPTPFGGVLYGGVALISLGLVVAIMRLRGTRDRPTALDADSRARRRNMFRLFGVVVALEMLLIALASTLLSRFGHPEFIAPVVGLIVGGHFIPLAHIFDESIYNLTGAAMMLIGGVATLALVLGVTLGAPYRWSVIAGVANAVLLWITAGYLVDKVHRALPRVDNRQPARS